MTNKIALYIAIICLLIVLLILNQKYQIIVIKPIPDKYLERITNLTAKDVSKITIYNSTHKDIWELDKNDIMKEIININEIENFLTLFNSVEKWEPNHPVFKKSYDISVITSNSNIDIDFHLMNDENVYIYFHKLEQTNKRYTVRMVGNAYKSKEIYLWLKINDLL